jgi:hypothetical protein
MQTAPLNGEKETENQENINPEKRIELWQK